MVTGIYGKMKKERHTDTTSISETHWTGQGKVQLAKSTLEEIMTTNDRDWSRYIDVKKNS